MSIFQRRHYNAIADILKETYFASDWDETIFTQLVDDFLLLFEGDNSRFDRERFLDYMNMIWTDNNQVKPQ